jgi:coat protein Gp5
MSESNTFLSISQITYESAMSLKNKLQLGARVNREYSSEFARVGAKAGQTISIRKPPRYTIRRGPTANFQGIQEQYTSLTVAQAGVDLPFSSFDFTLSMDNFRARYLDQAIATIANDIDQTGMALYKGVPWMIGTPGVTPSSYLTYLQAGAILSEEAAPRGEDRSLMLNPLSMATIANANSVLFNPQGAISEQYRSALMSQAGGWQWYEDQNVTAHTVGPLGGTPLIDGAGQTGSSILTKGWTSSAAPRLKEGDVFTIAGVYAVNPQSRLSQGRLRMFRAGADVSSTSGGAATIPIYPAITPLNANGTQAQFQTVLASPADSAAITVLGAANTISPQNLGFHRNALTLATVDMDVPRGAVEVERVSDPDSGLSIRCIYGYDLTNDVSGIRLDVLYGWALIYPELCVRIAA